MGTCTHQKKEKNRVNRLIKPEFKKGLRWCVLDIETDALVKPSVVHVAVVLGDNGHVSVCLDRDQLIYALAEYDVIVGHNVIGFDGPVLRELWDIDIFAYRVIDTNVLSRVYFDNSDGQGHSLDAWGKRLGYHKIEFKDFDKLTDGMVEYCIRDTEVTKKLFKLFRHHGVLEGEACYRINWLEHNAAAVCSDMRVNGFRFNTEAARELLSRIVKRQEELLAEFQKVFKPQLKLEREFEPRVKKDGTISSVGFKKLGDPDYVFKQGERIIHSLEDVVSGELVSIYRVVNFNPSSEKMVIDELWRYGWQPVDKTKGHQKALKDKQKWKERGEEFKRYGWQLNEANLSTLPDDAPDEIQHLKEYLVLVSRRGLLEGWLELERYGRIHGDFLHIGTWTHRMAHRNPNMGNVPSHGLYGKECRSLWIADEDCVLVGTDASGIQMRIFAHYSEDKELIETIVSGADVHDMHAERLGGVERQRAKTFIYAWLLGAGVTKVAEILGCNVNEAKHRMELFLQSYPRLKELKTELFPKWAARGWFEALDGRRIPCRSSHLMLAGMLQSGEAIVMKLANILWRKKLMETGVWFKQVNFVHDEWQTVCKPEDADVVGRTQVEAIIDAGRRLNLLCPLDGEYRVGSNWHETH